MISSISFFFFFFCFWNVPACKKRKRLVVVVASNERNDINNNINSNVNNNNNIAINELIPLKTFLRKRPHSTADDSARPNVKIYGIAHREVHQQAPPTIGSPKLDLITREVVVPAVVLQSVPLAAIAESAGVVIANGSLPDVVSVTGFSSNVAEACAALMPAIAAALIERAAHVARLQQQPQPTVASAADRKPCAMHGECVVCLSDEALLCCVPCGHLALCERDAVTVAASRQCPVCRASIDNLLRVYRSTSD